MKSWGKSANNGLSLKHCAYYFDIQEAILPEKLLLRVYQILIKEKDEALAALSEKTVFLEKAEFAGRKYLYLCEPYFFTEVNSLRAEIIDTMNLHDLKQV